MNNNLKILSVVGGLLVTFMAWGSWRENARQQSQEIAHQENEEESSRGLKQALNRLHFAADLREKFGKEAGDEYEEKMKKEDAEEVQRKILRELEASRKKSSRECYLR